MTQAVLAQRVGKELKGVKGPNGADAKIDRSILMKEVFPDKPGMELVFDFYTDEQGKCAVHVQYKTGGKTRHTGHWTISAIENLDSEGLKGFREFAGKASLKGFQLANLIKSLRPKG